MTYPELSLVRLTRDVGDFPSGTVGTVVHVYPDGEAYEVEFNLAMSGRNRVVLGTVVHRNRVVTVEPGWVEAA